MCRLGPSSEGLNILAGARNKRGERVLTNVWIADVTCTASFISVGVALGGTIAKIIPSSSRASNNFARESPSHNVASQHNFWWRCTKSSSSSYRASSTTCTKSYGKGGSAVTWRGKRAAVRMTVDNMRESTASISSRGDCTGSGDTASATTPCRKLALTIFRHFRSTVCGMASTFLYISSSAAAALVTASLIRARSAFPFVFVVDGAGIPSEASASCVDEGASETSSLMFPSS
mmetsp:Transcript_24584/g.73718  ORF Transcript_24584/g.73718 Transcript_24584/m.73718 type:complete len:233 (-) Transcript_24584:2469-3167(-)